MSSQIQTLPISRPSGKETLTHILALLKPFLPVSLPLYRRLQFGRFFPATALITNVAPGASQPAQQNQPWLVAFVDRSCRPETEVWFFGNWEAAAEGEDGAEVAKIDALVRDAVTAMKALDVPRSIHQDSNDGDGGSRAPDTDRVGFSRADYGGHLADTNVMLWGAVHERTVPVLQRLGVVSLEFKTSLMPNWTFTWDVASLGAGRELPEGLRWGEVRRKDLGLVRSRTQIPRQERTLAVLPSMAVFPVQPLDAAPVAWAFIGLDASLTSLHVEPEWRGRGIAKAVTVKIFKEKMDLFWEKDDTIKWAFGFVIVGNRESEGMCRSLAGRSEWQSYWLRVDLGKL